MITCPVPAPSCRRAKEGSASPLEAVGHKGSNESHPVASQVITAIGAGIGGGIGVAVGKVEQDPDELVHQVGGGGQHGRSVVAQRAGLLDEARPLAGGR